MPIVLHLLSRNDIFVYLFKQLLGLILVFPPLLFYIWHSVEMLIVCEQKRPWTSLVKMFKCICSLSALWHWWFYCVKASCSEKTFNPLTAKLFNLNFHPLEVVSRWRDPQLQVSLNYSDLTKWRSTVFKKLLIDVPFSLYHVQKVVHNVLIKKENTNIWGTGG